MNKIFVFLALSIGLKIDIVNERNLLYTVKTTIGTPGQKLGLSVSVFSPYTWVVESGCYPCSTADHTFKPDESSTFVVNDRKSVSFQFIEGVVVGIMCTDIINIKPTEELLSSFVLASSNYNIDLFTGDGALGLCPSSLYISQLIDQDLIPEPIFSIFFSDNGFTTDSTRLSSALLIGEYDLSFTRNPSNQTIYTTGCWEFTVNSFSLSDSYFSTSTPGFLDSSLEYILGPKQYIIYLQQILISEYYCGFQSQGYLQCNCPDLSAYMDIVFQFNHKYIVLTPKQYFLESDGNCIFLMFYRDGQTFQVWRFGMPLFREYYMVFNVKENSVALFRAVLSKIEIDDSESIQRWVTITIVVLVITITFVTLYIIYALLCKNHSR